MCTLLQPYPKYFEPVALKCCFLASQCIFFESQCHFLHLIQCCVVFSDCSNLTDEETIKRLQDEILSSMDDYIRSRYPKLSIAHLGRILLYLPRLRYVKYLVPADFIFPEITKNPDFISNFIKDVLYLPTTFRTAALIVKNSDLPL